jgi:hypothetical protein
MKLEKLEEDREVKALHLTFWDLLLLLYFRILSL